MEIKPNFPPFSFSEFILPHLKMVCLIRCKLALCLSLPPQLVVFVHVDSKAGTDNKAWAMGSVSQA